MSVTRLPMISNCRHISCRAAAMKFDVEVFKGAADNVLSTVSNRVDWVARGHSRRQLVCRVHSSIWMRKCCFERHFLSKSTTRLFGCWWQGVFCVVIITSLLIHFLGWLFRLAGNGFNIGLRLEKNLMRRNHVSSSSFFLFVVVPLVFFPFFWIEKKRRQKPPRSNSGGPCPAGRPCVGNRCLRSQDFYSWIVWAAPLFLYVKHVTP